MLDLIKKNIHMDCIKAKAGNQLTVEDDVNIPDLRPDIDKVIFHSGVIKIEEAKAGNGQVTVRGALTVNILYTSDEEEEPLGKVETSLPFEEQFHMEGVEAGDSVYVRHTLGKLYEVISYCLRQDIGLYGFIYFLIFFILWYL